MRLDLDTYEHNTYLGDGLYAGWDGYHIVLNSGSSKVYVEAEVIEAFQLYLKQHNERLKGIKNV